MTLAQKGGSGEGDGTAAPLVTFFVLAYRQERFVREAIASAFAQTHSPLEIILSDDASPDRTYAIMEEMAASYRGPHRVVLNRNETNLGLVGHLDRVMARASGAFLVQNAGDDISRPERTARLVAAWQAGRGRVMLVHSAMEGIDAEGRPAIRPPRRRPPLATDSPFSVMRGEAEITGASCGWDRALFDRFGPLGPGPLVEDRPLAFRAALLGEIRYLPEPLLLYREGGASDPAGAAFRLDGYHLKRRRWLGSYLRAHLADMARLPPDPAEAEACRRFAEAELARLDFELALAEAGRAGRLAALPRALGLGLRRRDPAFPRIALRYLFARVYEWRAERRRRARQAAERI